MPQFNSIHLEHLLKLCCWRIKVSPNKGGFEVLIAKMGESFGKSPLISVKYLQNLWSDIQSGVKSEQVLTRQEDYIFELLQFCDYLSWIEFEEEIARIESYLKEYPSTSQFDEVSVLILTTGQEVDRIISIISFHRKILGVRVEIKQSNFESINDLKVCLEDFAYVTTYLSPKSSDVNIHPIDVEKWHELTETNRFVPVWAGNEKTNFSVDGISNRNLVIGKRGLMLSLIVLDVVKNRSGNAISSAPNAQKSVPHQRIKKFKGIIANGDLNMTGGHLSLGDTNYYSGKYKQDGSGEDK